MMIVKIVNKSRYWWRHGKHKVIYERTGAQPDATAKIIPLDTRRPGWTRRKH